MPHIFGRNTTSEAFEAAPSPARLFCAHEHRTWSCIAREGAENPLLRPKTSLFNAIRDVRTKRELSRGCGIRGILSSKKHSQMNGRLPNAARRSAGTRQTRTFACGKVVGRRVGLRKLVHSPDEGVRIARNTNWNCGASWFGALGVLSWMGCSSGLRGVYRNPRYRAV